jgi:hypothetical protein
VKELIMMNNLGCRYLIIIHFLLVEYFVTQQRMHVTNGIPRITLAIAAIVSVLGIVIVLLIRSLIIKQTRNRHSELAGSEHLKKLNVLPDSKHLRKPREEKRNKHLAIHGKKNKLRSEKEEGKMIADYTPLPSPPPIIQKLEREKPKMSSVFIPDIAPISGNDMRKEKEEPKMCADSNNELQPVYIREMGDKVGLQASLGNQAAVLYARGDLNGPCHCSKRWSASAASWGT